MVGEVQAQFAPVSILAGRTPDIHEQRVATQARDGKESYPMLKAVGAPREAPRRITWEHRQTTETCTRTSLDSNGERHCSLAGLGIRTTTNLTLHGPKREPISPTKTPPVTQSLRCFLGSTVRRQTELPFVPSKLGCWRRASSNRHLKMLANGKGCLQDPLMKASRCRLTFSFAGEFGTKHSALCQHHPASFSWSCVMTP